VIRSQERGALGATQTRDLLLRKRSNPLSYEGKLPSYWQAF